MRRGTRRADGSDGNDAQRPRLSSPLSPLLQFSPRRHRSNTLRRIESSRLRSGTVRHHDVYPTTFDLDELRRRERRRRIRAATTSTTSSGILPPSPGGRFLDVPVVSEWTSSRPSTSYSATLSTAPVPSTSSSAVSIPSRLHNAIPFDADTSTYFLVRTPGGRATLNSYTRALEKKSNDEAEKCGVCYDELFNEIDDIVVPTCGHCVHDKCLGQWHEIKQQFICPTCREGTTRGVVYDIISPTKFKHKWLDQTE